MAGQISGGARRFVFVSALFLIIWQVADLVGVPRRFSVTVALFGFVFHMIFGKAYALIPSYFNRQLTQHWIPRVHLPCATLGTGLLAIGSLSSIPTPISLFGSIIWGIGVGLFFWGIGNSIRDNLTGRETGTSSANQDRRDVDRFANAFIPISPCLPHGWLVRIDGALYTISRTA